MASDLLAKGADCNAVSKWTQMTPAHYAAFFGAPEVLEVLVKKGKPDLTAACPKFEGATPLHLACMAGCSRTVAVLLKHGADAALRGVNGKTPLEAAREVFASGVSDVADAEWDAIFAQVGAAAPALPPPTPRPSNDECILLVICD